MGKRCASIFATTVCVCVCVRLRAITIHNPSSQMRWLPHLGSVGSGSSWQASGSLQALGAGRSSLSGESALPLNTDDGGNQHHVWQARSIPKTIGTVSLLWVPWHRRLRPLRERPERQRETQVENRASLLAAGGVKKHRWNLGTTTLVLYKLKRYIWS